jgi:adenine/guanine phosphoribosyltransferase-like PRPP-binding protein
MARTDEAVIAAMIVLPEGQTELVAGEYEVSALPMYGTVMAGQYTADGVNPSYAMTTADQKLWYFVSGKVTVEGDGSIVIDALNSNGKAIKSTLNHLQGEGIDEVNAAVKATKTLKNGQLIIEKAGVRYNAQGAVIR